MSLMALKLRGIIFCAALAAQFFVAQAVAVEISAAPADQAQVSATDAATISGDHATQAKRLLRREEEEFLPKSIGSLNPFGAKKPAAKPAAKAKGKGAGGAAPKGCAPPKIEPPCLSCERKAKMVELQFKSKKKTGLMLANQALVGAEAKLKMEERIPKAAKEKLGKCSERAKKITTCHTANEHQAKEGEAKPKEISLKKRETEKKTKELAAKEMAMKKKGKEEKEKKEERPKKEKPIKERTWKEGLYKYNVSMTATEKAQKWGLKKYRLELRAKESRESELKAKREKEIKERGVKRDGREEFVPKQYYVEKKCKVAAEKNAKDVAAKEERQKKVYYKEQVQKSKKTADTAITAEKEARYKLAAETEQIAKKKDEPASKEKDTKERQKKARKRNEAVVKKTGSAIQTVKVHVDESETKESASKTALKLSIARNEQGAKEQNRKAMEVAKLKNSSESASKEKVQKSWETQNEKGGKTEREKKDKSEIVLKHESEAYTKQARKNKTQGEVKAQVKRESGDKEHITSLSASKMKILKSSLLVERRNERKLKFKQSTDLDKKPVVGPDAQILFKAKNEVQDKLKHLSMLKHTEQVTKSNSHPRHLARMKIPEAENKKKLQQSKEDTKKHLAYIEKHKRLSEWRCKLKMAVQVKTGEDWNATLHEENGTANSSTFESGKE